MSNKMMCEEVVWMSRTYHGQEGEYWEHNYVNVSAPDDPQSIHLLQENRISGLITVTMKSSVSKCRRTRTVPVKISPSKKTIVPTTLTGML